MSKCLICLAATVVLLVSGCAGLKSNSSQGNELAEEDIRVGTKTPREGEDAVYYILAAELAGQRGQYEVALDNYLMASSLTSDIKVIQRATQIALYLKKTDKALETALKWQERDPGSMEARRLVAMLLIKSGRMDEALDKFAELLKMPGVDIENTFIDLVKLLGADVSKEDGLAFMSRLEESFPHMADLHFAYALLAAEKGEYPLALGLIEKALAEHPDWGRARLLQAQVMTKMGNSQKALEVIQKALQSDPNNLRLRLIYSQYLAKSGDLRGTERELRTILAKDPNNEDAMLAMAMAELELGQEARARQYFERLAQTPGRGMQAYFYLGLLEARQNHLQSAVAWFDKVTDGPMAFDAQVNAITALINLKQIPEARQRLTELRKQYPQEALKFYLLEAELLTKNKEYDEAFQLLSQALEEMPGQIELLYSRALVAEQLDRVDVLESDLRRVLEKNPDDPNALNALGFTLADRSERLDEAKNYIGKALQLKPQDPAILDSYGWVNYRLGDNEKALEYLHRAYELNQDPEIGAHLGEVLWESGNRKEAKKIWMESLRKEPNHENMKKVMMRYPEAFK